jgi:hypothetical protein
MSTFEPLGISLGFTAFTTFLAICGFANSYRLTKQLHSARAALQQIVPLRERQHAYTAARIAEEGLRACSDSN